VKGTRLAQTPLGGVSELIPQPDGSATEIVNFTVHKQTGGWDNRIGYEKYLSSSATSFAPFDTLGRVDSLFIWSTHQGAQQWPVFEADGALYYLQNYGADQKVVAISGGRTKPTATQAPGSYAAYGRFLYVVNGNDTPVRYGGWPHGDPTSPSVPVYDMGWHALPAPPTTWGVSTTPEHGPEYGGSFAMWARQTKNATHKYRTPTGGVEANSFTRVLEWETGWNEGGLGDEKAANAFEKVADGTYVDPPLFSSYKYRVTFINNAGAESPLSDPSNLVIWEQPKSRFDEDADDDEVPAEFTNYRWIVGLEIPTGPAGTIARKIYRSKDLGDGVEIAATYYDLAVVPNNTETFYFDNAADTELITRAPTSADSVIFPATGARFSAIFKNCMFIDSGSESDTALFWSNPGFPDTYSATDFADVGTKEGGGITGFHAHYNYLLILRQRSIDYIHGDSPNFGLSPLSQSVGTSAANAITTIPDIGVIFLASDGVYVVTGGFEGGSTIEIKRISDPIIKTIERMNKDVLPRAVACYSHKWREWHCYFAADGHDRPNLGIVLHLDKMAWSVRENFPVGALSTTFDGDIVFGHVDGHTGSSGQAGLFVISGRRNMGESVVYDDQSTQQGTTSLVSQGPPTSKYRSKWHDFGDPNKKKKVHYVYLYALTEGDNTIPMTHFKDYDYVGVAAPAARPQTPDATDQGVYDSVKTDLGLWEEERLTEIRYPVSQGACSCFQFEVETANDMVLVGYAIELTSPEGTKIIKGKRV